MSQSINQLNLYLPEKLFDIINSESDYVDLIWNIAEAKYDVCRWGSCQYSSACAFFDAITILNTYLDTNKVFDIIELKVDLGDSNPKNLIFHLIVEEYKKRNDYCCNDRNGASENDSENDCDDDYKKIISCESVDESFVIFKESANDLWTTMRIIFDAVYPNAHILTRHPEYYITGLMGWLLVKNGWVTDPDISFKGFCT